MKWWIELENMIRQYKEKLKDLPLNPGVYFFKDSRGKFLYIGKAKNLKKRVGNYFQKKDLEVKTIKMLFEAQKLDWIKTESEIEALLLEAEMIKRYRPRFNVDLRDDKSYLYLGISWTEEYPRIFYGRRPNLSDRENRYFGPYTSPASLKSAMKFLRKIFPYRTCKIKIPHKKCLWYQMRNLSAPCDQSISVSNYRKIISSLMKFLRGGKKDLIKKYQKEMKKASHGQNYELASRLRDQIYALEHLHKAAIFSDTSGGMPKRIEAYDISNIMGKEATGSMIVFTNGEKETDEYRKFKIKSVLGISDTAMLAEILRRRFDNDWPMPNLIIIDGGVGQLNIVRKIILEKAKVNIPIIAIAKGIDRKGEKLFFAGRRVLDDINLIKQIRDEAHRFAVSYHRILRRKKLTEK
jgi:excinuclease ABC subunit C